MLNKIGNIIKELEELAAEIKTLKKREIAYKAWLKKFKQENEELRQTQIVLCKQRNDALAELSIKQTESFKEEKSGENKIKQLIFANHIVCQQRDEALLELSTKRAALLQSLQEAQEAKYDRDRAIDNLDEVIDKLEAYKIICERVKNLIPESDRSLTSWLIQKADKLLFEEEITNTIEIELDCRENPQMFTDRASINRSLLDR